MTDHGEQSYPQFVFTGSDGPCSQGVSLNRSPVHHAKHMEGSIPSRQYRQHVDLSPIGPWIVIATAIPAFVVLLVSVIALRGTDPKERPEIIRALAELFQATRRLRLPTPKNPSA